MLKLLIRGILFVLVFFQCLHGVGQQSFFLLSDLDLVLYFSIKMIKNTLLFFLKALFVCFTIFLHLLELISLLLLNLLVFLFIVFIRVDKNLNVSLDLLILHVQDLIIIKEPLDRIPGLIGLTIGILPFVPSFLNRFIFCLDDL